MAKISSCFPLCPLIDDKYFFGVSDVGDNGHVIVTLGKNMVIEYKISDQKQVHNWSTNVRLSAPVVFDRNSNQYVGLFNSKIIRVWNATDVDISKTKKYKFDNNIHCLATTSATRRESGVDEELSVVLVFKDGRVAPLNSYTLENSKNMDKICRGMESIIDVRNNSLTIEDVQMVILNGYPVVCIITLNSETKTTTCHLMPVQYGLWQPVSFVLSDTESSECDRGEMTGYAFTGGDNLKLFTLWSDNNLRCLELYPSNLQDVGVLFPGEVIMQLPLINTCLKVAILPLDSTGCNIAVYGADPSEEGALLIIVHIPHKLVQCRFNFKLYVTSPKLWLGSSTDMLLTVGRHLAVARYSLVKQRLVSLIGKRQNDDTIIPAKTLTWQSVDDSKHHDSINDRQSIKEAYQRAIQKIKDSGNLFPDYGCHSVDLDDSEICHLDELVSSQLARGSSEAMAFENAITSLIETYSTTKLICIYALYVDVPLNCLLVTIDYCLKGESNEGNVTEKQKSQEKDILLKIVLQNYVTVSTKALALVRNKFSVAVRVKLIKRLGDYMTKCPGNLSLINWATLVLDSIYPDIAFAMDEDVTDAIKELKTCVNIQLTQMTTWQGVALYVKMLTTGRGFVRPEHFVKDTMKSNKYKLDRIMLD